MESLWLYFTPEGEIAGSIRHEKTRPMGIKGRGFNQDLAPGERGRLGVKPIIGLAGNNPRSIEKAAGIGTLRLAVFA